MRVMVCSVGGGREGGGVRVMVCSVEAHKVHVIGCKYTAEYSTEHLLLVYTYNVHS